MAAGRDNPGRVSARRHAMTADEANGGSGGLIVVERPSAAITAAAHQARNGSNAVARRPRWRTTGQNSLVGSAARINLGDRKAVRRSRAHRQDWQIEAWDYWDEIGELRYVTSYMANLISKLRLYPAVDSPDGVVAVDSETSGEEHQPAAEALQAAGVTPAIAALAVETLARLRSVQGGQSAMLRELALNLDVAGECSLHGHAEPVDSTEPGNPTVEQAPVDLAALGEPADNTADPATIEDWNVRSIDELISTGDRFELRLGPGSKTGEPIPDTDLVIRIWERHPRFSEQASCAMRSVLGECEALLLLSREIRATAKCVDEATEILTANGWRTHDQLHPGDLVLTLDHATGLSRWQPVEEVHRYERVAEPMMAMSTRGHSSLTTLNHRWPVLAARKDGRRRLWKTSETLAANDYIPCAAPCADLPAEAKHSDAFVELVAWFWTEGYVHNGQADITQSYEQNPEKCDRIRRALSTLYGPARQELRQGRAKTGGRRTPGTTGPRQPTVARMTAPAWRETTHPDKGCAVFHLNQAASEPLLGVAPDKAVDLAFVRSLTQAQLDLFVGVSLAADGTTDRRSGSRSITQNRPDRLDAFEMACILAGLRVTRPDVAPVVYPDGRLFPQWRVSIWQHDTAWAGPASTGIGRSGRRPGDAAGDLSGRTVIEYSGTVWCPQTADGTWLARRDGTVYWTGNSRLSNGILLIPSELSFGSIDPTTDPGDGEEEEDPFDAELQESMITPIMEEGSASAVVPLVLRGPAELLQHVNHLAIDKTLDPVLDARIEQRILRMGRGLNMPTETTTGFMATTFANASAIKRSEYEDHVEPRATLIVDALTNGYFQWALEMAGVDGEIARNIFVWYDPSALLIVEDMSEQAVEAHKDGIISDAARRKYQGFKEEDAPDADELARRVVLHGGRIDPTIFGYLVKQALDDENLPIPAPAAGILGVAESVSAAPVPGAPPEAEVNVGGEALEPIAEPAPEPPPAPILPPPTASPTAEPAPGTPPPEPKPAEPVAAAATPGDRDAEWKRLGRTLAGIDRELRTRITAKLDQAMSTALDKAGARIRTRIQRDKGGEKSILAKSVETTPRRQIAAQLGKQVVDQTGLSDEQLVHGEFETALDDINLWVGLTYDRAMRAVERVAGPPNAARRQERDARHTRDRARAISWLRDNLHQLAGARLYSPTPTIPPTGEHDGTVLIPASLVRAAVAVAGGATPRGGTGDTTIAVASAWVDIGGDGPVTDENGDPLGGIGTGPNVMGAVGDGGGETEGYQWEYGEGLRSEFIPHVDLDGVTVSEPDQFEWGSNYEGFPEVDVPFPGDHEGCFPASALVSGPRAASATLRYWQGEIVEASLASGQLLAATPNHPVLTPGGWMPLGELAEGDDVLGCPDGERITGLVPNGYQVPARIEEIADTLRVDSSMAARRVEVTAEHFHGDGTGSEVAVVWTDCDLRDRIDATLRQPASQEPLTGADPGVRVRLAGESTTAAGLETVRTAPLGLEGVGGYRPAALRRPGGVDEPLGFADTPDADPALSQLRRDGTACSADRLGQNLDRLAALVTADKIVHVERHPFAGHVYNLDTRVGWYISSSIIVRNCVCDLTPVLIGPDESTRTETPEDLLAREVDVVPGGESDTGAAATEETGDSPAETPTGFTPADAPGWSTLNPSEFADWLGYTPGTGDISEADLKEALGQVTEARHEVRAAGAALEEDTLAMLERLEGAGRYSMATIHLNDPDYGAFFRDISDTERSRLRQNWQSKTTKGLGWDELFETISARIFHGQAGTGMDEQKAFEWWLEQTRIADAAKAISNGKLINVDRYGNKALNEIIESPYDLTELFGRKEQAGAEIARVHARATTDQARDLLGYGATGPKLGPAPWEMSQTEYVNEAERLDDLLANVRPTEVDTWGDAIYSATDQRTIDRMAELVPPGIDDPENPASFNELYRQIIELARSGALI